MKNYTNHNNLALFSKKSNTYKKSSGNDERYTKNITEINEQTYKIYKYFEKKRIIDILKNNNISKNDKLQLIEYNMIRETNLKAGGLVDDFS